MTPHYDPTDVSLQYLAEDNDGHALRVELPAPGASKSASVYVDSDGAYLSPVQVSDLLEALAPFADHRVGFPDSPETMSREDALTVAQRFTTDPTGMLAVARFLVDE